MLIIPNLADATHQIQAEVDSVDFQILAGAFAGIGVVSGCTPSTDGQNVTIAAGMIRDGDTTYQVSSASLSVATYLNAGSNRLAIAAVNRDTQSLELVVGAPSESPVFPAIYDSVAETVDHIALAAVLIPAEASALVTGNVLDRRITVEVPQAEAMAGDTFDPTTDFAAQAANTVFAGPFTGADAHPAFRALTSADLPVITFDVFPSYPIKPCGRLSLHATESVSDENGARYVYYHPYEGALVPLWNGSKWEIWELPDNLSDDAETYGQDRLYDIFLYNNSGSLALHEVAWSNNTTRANSISKRNGLWVMSVDNTFLYLGTVYVNSSYRILDNPSNRLLFNAYNQVPRQLKVIETADSWTTTSTTWEKLNGSTANRIYVVEGLYSRDASIYLNIVGGVQASVQGQVGVGLNNDLANHADLKLWSVAAGSSSMASSIFSRPLPGGYNYLQLMQRLTGSGTGTFYGDAGAAANYQTGAVGYIWI